MHKLLDDYLVKKYPKIFVERNLSPRETCMCWGFPDDGWLYLLDNLCSNIQHRIDNPPSTEKKCLWNRFVRKWHNWIWNPFLYRLKLPYWLSFDYKMERKVIPQVIALQVKEKFGSLRFYYSGGDEKISAMIDFAESLSYHICEDCGRFDETVGRTEGWIHTVCSGCFKKSQSESDVDFVELQDKELVELWNTVKDDKKKEDYPKRQFETTMENVSKYLKQLDK